MHLPVKRVETETIITHDSICWGKRQNQDKYTCRQAPDSSPAGKHVIPGPQSPATGTGRSETCVDRWRGQVENFDPLDRRD